MSCSSFDSRRAALLVRSAVALGFVISVAAPHAQQPPATPPAQGTPGAKPAAPAPAAPAAAPAAPQKPLVPVVASSLAAKPDAYYGENVTMMATVDQTLSTIAFSVDQDKTKSTGQDVLVLAPRLNEPLEPNSYVTVIGEVVKFDATNAKVKDRLTGLSPEAIAKFNGKPVIVATSVINAAMNDVARRLPPKMTAEEEAFQKVMQKVGAANGAFRGIIEKSDAAAAKEQAAALKAAFISTEAFFKPHGKADAIGWAQDARKLAEAIELSAAAGKWDEVKAASTNIGKTCGTCHTAYRERYDDGSFRAKLTPPPAKPGSSL
ncbi:MAG: cytochrome c [Acidobacteria bacterium]|nr:cytochrome c [Acidobacteriota bacterium]